MSVWCDVLADSYEFTVLAVLCDVDDDDPVELSPSDFVRATVVASSLSLAYSKCQDVLGGTLEGQYWHLQCESFREV